ncbi:hypothetical protein LBMAG56_21720 [Verrucomicrobiota bacterium]|nr:hypothetical protein LBMAG56_21720 [Verrucomicrobiota bacterium]
MLNEITTAASIPAASAPDAICIHGAREHNLKNLSLVIPRGQFVVVTGVSGSGKSTLAFDLLFAEGQRRFLDSMNAYARQFVEQMARPEVDLITGIPPTVSIEQRVSRGGGKSTVATVTEIYHFVRLLFARLGTQFCPDCQVPVEAQTRDQLARRLLAEAKQRGDLILLAPVVKNRKGFHTEVAEWAARHGYAEVRADGKMHPTSERLRLDRFREHDVEIVTGVLEARARKAEKGLPSPQELIDETLRVGHGTLLALDPRGQVTVHSTERACTHCGRSFEALDPKIFSYNSAQGWCPQCRGFGELFYLPDVDRGARADAIEESWFEWQEGKRELCPACHGARLNPVARAVRLVLGGISTGGAGDRHVRPVGLVGPPDIETLAHANVDAALAWFAQLKLAGREADIARDILPEIRERLKFLSEVGLGYLQLGRAAPTLSGGEAQRMRLAAQLGSNLCGVLYVLDEPTIGLHSRDNEQLLAALQKLKARGNSLIVVEHDEETMRRADYIIDLGPGAGVHGGEVVAAGTLAELQRHPESITGQCLREQAAKRYPSRGERRAVVVEAAAAPKTKAAAKRKSPAKVPAPPSAEQTPMLTLRHAGVNNLQDLTVQFPLGRFVCVTGVSGSGKSTLVRDCLLPAVTAALRGGGRGGKSGGKGDSASAALAPRVTGWESLTAVYEVDQSPIGRTPRSTPATYIGFFDDIRQFFAQVPEARLRGYTPGRFSFNSVHGRCPACEGAGTIKLEMSFLPPAYVRCETCDGTRFNRETLDVLLQGRNIAQVLDLSVAEALEYFAAYPRIRRALEALRDTGLDYLKLGQISPTLSGGEAQRVKLVSHLLTGLKEAGTRPGRRAAQHLFILEEPTIGLHMADVRRLVEVLQRLVDAGHSVIVIEHNLDLIAEADWVIDLGPEGGAGGGRVVVEGTPETVARCAASHTGRYLRALVRR